MEEPCHEHDIDELYELTGLETKGDTGQVHPAAVAGVIRHAEGNDEEDDEDAQGQEKLPSLFQKVFHVHKGDDHIGDDAQDDEEGLLDDVPGMVGHIVGGAVDEQQPYGAGSQAQGQEHHVTLSEKVFDKAGKTHGNPPFFGGMEKLFK